jgi:DNA-binding NarL/FixJ family response regulator
MNYVMEIADQTRALAAACRDQQLPQPFGEPADATEEVDPNPRTIVICSPYPMMRSALGNAIRTKYADAKHAYATRLAEVGQYLAAGDVDLLLLDIGNPGTARWDELLGLRERHPATKVLVVAPLDDRETILKCLAAGVHGVVPSSVTPERLVRAAQTVLAGNIHVSPILAEPPRKDPAAPAHRASAGSADLTLRQAQVLRLLAAGCSNKEIARHLGLGVGTVKVHMAHLFASLGARSRLEAVVKSGVAGCHLMATAE